MTEHGVRGHFAHETLIDEAGVDDVQRAEHFVFGLDGSRQQTGHVVVVDPEKFHEL